MRWIDTDHIISWATRQDALGKLPSLIHDLVRATSPRSTFINFPDCRQIFNPGTDGFVNSPDATEYVPQGISIWELGTRRDIQAKAEEDYLRRTTDDKEYKPLESTFIFLTPHSWAGKRAWENEKRLEGKWNNIIVYDCSDLAGWLNIAEVVARDYAPIISYYPSDNVQTTKDFWFEWSNRQDGLKLPAKIVTAGREREMEQIKAFLNGGANIRAVKASSKEEAIAFIIACILCLSEDEQAVFFSKSIIIDTENNFRNISSKKQSLILISRIEGNIIHRGPAEGNHVFLPLGGDDNYSGDVITLPTINRDGMIAALREAGFSNEDAQNYTRESGHNITILKSLLQFQSSKSEWAKPENARMVIPAVLMGRWDEEKTGDKEALAIIAGENYETYIEKLTQWKNSEIPFIYQIGNTWRLASPIDAWSNLSLNFTKNDLEKLAQVFLLVLSSIRPSFDLEPEKRYMASFYGKESKYSEWLREGLAQSLILVAVYGNRLKLPNGFTSQSWVDSVVSKLLYGAEGKLWATLNYVMPLLAEASPSSFLQTIENSLAKSTPEIMKMFEEEPSLITPHSHHTGLLWGLEGLAWIQEYLPRVALVLAKLARMDPGGKLNNRPLNSLRSIFLPWMPQTDAGLLKRQEVLRLIIKHEPEIAWKLMISLLPKHHDVSHPTHKTRWRLFGQNTESKNLSYAEIWENHSLLVSDLLSITEFNEIKISQLIKIVDELRPNDRNSIIAFIKDNKDKIKQVDYSIWHELRKILGHHRSHPDANWALPEAELESIEYLYKELFPVNTLEKYKWLFDENWPEFPEGYKIDDVMRDRQQEKINENRTEALQKIKDEFGITKIIELADEVKETFSFGQAAAYIITDENEVLQFLSEKRLLGTDPYVVRGFVYKLEQLKGFNCVIDIFWKIKNKHFSNEALANFLIPLQQKQELWDLMEVLDSEITDSYWRLMTPYLYNLSLEEKIYALEKLLSVDRGLTVISESYHSITELDTEFIIKVLESAVSSTEKIRFPDYQIEKIFDNLDERIEINKNILARLEWKYLVVLSGSYTHRSPKILHEELSTNPEFLIEMLKIVYRAQNEIESDELSEEERKVKIRMAEQAYLLLTSWKKLPGTDSKNNIDQTALVNWVNRVRELALKEDRLDPADIHIGRIFANYPENQAEQWPPDVICEIIDTINSDVLTRNFRSEIFNINGSSTKALYEGGERERGLAKYFTNLAEQINYKWPITASVFVNLAKGYEEESVREDDRAKRDSLEY